MDTFVSPLLIKSSKLQNLHAFVSIEKWQLLLNNQWQGDCMSLTDTRPESGSHTFFQLKISRAVDMKCHFLNLIWNHLIRVKCCIVSHPGEFSILVCASLSSYGQKCSLMLALFPTGCHTQRGTSSGCLGWQGSTCGYDLRSNWLLLG